MVSDIRTRNESLAVALGLFIALTACASGPAVTPLGTAGGFTVAAISDIGECRASRPLGEAHVTLSQSRATPGFLRLFADSLPLAEAPELRLTLQNRLLLTAQMTASPSERPGRIDSGRGFPEADTFWHALGQADRLAVVADGATLLSMPVADAAALRDAMAACLASEDSHAR